MRFISFLFTWPDIWLCQKAQIPSVLYDVLGNNYTHVLAFLYESNRSKESNIQPILTNKRYDMVCILHRDICKHHLPLFKNWTKPKIVLNSLNSPLSSAIHKFGKITLTWFPSTKPAIVHWFFTRLTCVILWGIYYSF